MVIAPKDATTRRATEAQVSLATVPSRGQAKSIATAVRQDSLRERRPELEQSGSKRGRSQVLTQAMRASSRVKGREHGARHSLPAVVGRVRPNGGQGAAVFARSSY
jgi:hypothetical protein